MNKFLLLSIFILLCCVHVQALKCRVCKVATGCRKDKEESCEALPGQQCTHIKGFREGKEIFYMKGCSLPGDKCHIKKNKGLESVVTDCCNDRDFCNE